MPSGSYYRTWRALESSLGANHSRGLFQTNCGVTFRTRTCSQLCRICGSLANGNNANTSRK